jgi:hypothetical protein
LWLTRMAEPNAPRPTCSMISYCSILDSILLFVSGLLLQWVVLRLCVHFSQHCLDVIRSISSLGTFRLVYTCSIFLLLQVLFFTAALQFITSRCFSRPS